MICLPVTHSLNSVMKNNGTRQIHTKYAPDDEFNREILKTEIKRFTMMACLMLFILIFIPANLLLIFPEDSARVGINFTLLYPALLLIFLVMCYELYSRHLYSGYIRTNRPPPLTWLI